MQNLVDNAEGPYIPAWRDLKRRTYLLPLLFIGWVPFVFLDVAVSGFLASVKGFAWTATIPIAFSFVSWLAIPVSWIRARFFRCPRCRRPFAVNGIPVWRLSKAECDHCGLRYGTPSDPGGMEQSIAEIKLRRKRRYKRRLLIGIPICAGLLIVLQVLLQYGAKFVAPARKCALAELTSLQAAKYKNAQTLATPAFAKQLAGRPFQTTWNMFLKKYPPAGPPIFRGVDRFPKTTIGLVCALPTKNGGTGTAVLLLVKQGTTWRVDGLRLFEHEEDWLRTDPKYAANQGNKNYKPGQNWWFPGTNTAPLTAGPLIRLGSV